MVPSHDLPIMPTLPLDQYAAVVVVPVTEVYPVRAPFSQSITDFADVTSEGPPTSTQPCDRLVPARSTSTTA